MINILEQVVIAVDGSFPVDKNKLLVNARYCFDSGDLDVSALLEAIAADLDADGFARNPHLVRPAVRLAQRALRGD